MSSISGKRIWRERKMMDEVDGGERDGKMMDGGGREMGRRWMVYLQ